MKFYFLFIFFCYFCFIFLHFYFVHFVFAFVLFWSCWFSFLNFSYSIFFHSFFFHFISFFEMEPNETTWPRTDIAPKINHYGRGLTYACAAAVCKIKRCKKNHILYLCHMKGHEASISFHQKTWYQACLLFMLLALKKAKT